MQISQDKSEKLTRQISSVSVATAISRVLGYVRDMLIAQMFGAGIAADAFYAAYRIPNLFRRLLEKALFPCHSSRSHRVYRDKNQG